MVPVAPCTSPRMNVEVLIDQPGALLSPLDSICCAGDAQGQCPRSDSRLPTSRAGIFLIPSQRPAPTGSDWMWAAERSSVHYSPPRMCIYRS